MDYESRYKKLNEKQRQAVDTIEGPVLVVAGPGTGKTELLSMRAANILRRTDTLPENILCLTFTESGAASMRERLKSIIGKDAYKVAIHTFHSFGTEIINQNGQYFYRGAAFRPADELSSYELLRGIFDQLDYSSPLASQMNGEYTYLRDTLMVISELKKSGLTHDELVLLLDKNAAAIEALEPALQEVFLQRISKSTSSMLREIMPLIRKYDTEVGLPNIVPLAQLVADSLETALAEAEASGKTTPITAWRTTWMKKNAKGELVLKSREREEKLRVVSVIYQQYLNKMQEAELYDFDDMILRVTHAMELFPELRFNLQEKHQYIMVDEFQDTNLAQMRILENLTSNEASAGRPNILAVGDDDQAIYSFQGADISNILQFESRYRDVAIITLTDNYRSNAPILEASRQVITQGSGRLETVLSSVNKKLTPHREDSDAHVTVTEHEIVTNERQALVTAIKLQLNEGVPPSNIAVLARRHHEITALLPYFATAGIDINYERRDNVLDIAPIIVLEQVARVALALAGGAHDEANGLLPELMAHPAWGFAAADIWKLSLDSYKERAGWIERMLVTPQFKPFGEWLIELSRAILHEPLEISIDTIIGSPHSNVPEETEGEEDAFAEQAPLPPFVSPLYEYFFSDKKRESEPAEYLVFLEALRTIRAKLREYQPSQPPKLATLIEFIDLHRDLGSAITSIRVSADGDTSGVNLMTAHKSKGLEFDTVYVIGAIDSMWGERVRGKSRLISYPENLPIAPSGDSVDERLRLFFVAMTRAKRQLHISYSTSDENGKSTTAASFLLSTSLKVQQIEPQHSLEAALTLAETQWYDRIIAMPSADMRSLLASSLEKYKLSVTHLNNFLDVTRGGPQTFLINNLLRFPHAMNAAASYGTAIHIALQHAHAHLAATGERKSIEEVVQDYHTSLSAMHLTEDDFATFLQKGTDTLENFLDAHYDSFSPTQKVELNFNAQHVIVGDARLSGALDLVDIDNVAKTIAITDYKTGKGSSNWKGATDYEKVKLHKYKQQLMFYRLLVENSRDYRNYTVDKSCLQFVEADKTGECPVLEADFTREELAEFTQLITAVWKRIMTLDLPDTSTYEPTYKGMVAFEADLLAES